MGGSYNNNNNHKKSNQQNNNNRKKSNQQSNNNTKKKNKSSNNRSNGYGPSDSVVSKAVLREQLFGSGRTKESMQLLDAVVKSVSTWPIDEVLNIISTYGYQNEITWHTSKKKIYVILAEVLIIHMSQGERNRMLDNFR